VLRGDLPDRGGGDLDPKDEQFTVDAPVSPAAVLRRQTQYQGTDRPEGSWPSGPVRTGDPGVPAGDQVTVPAQHRLRAHEQAQPVQ
jgi:hypothetical protein